MMEKITGFMNVPFTPFYENDDINYEPLGTYVEFLVKNGLEGVFVNGSSSEGYMLTDGERMRLAKHWLEVSPVDFKVAVHVGSAYARPSQRLAAHAQSVGVYTIGAVTPPLPRIGRVEKLVAYCQEITCGAPRLPFYFRHVPAFSGVYLSITEFSEAMDGRISNFADIKYIYENLYEYSQCRLYRDGKFDMFHRQGETLLPCLAMGGARDDIGGTASYNGRTLAGTLGTWKSGDLECARDLQNFTQ